MCIISITKKVARIGTAICNVLRQLCGFGQGTSMSESTIFMLNIRYFFTFSFIPEADKYESLNAIM